MRKFKRVLSLFLAMVLTLTNASFEGFAAEESAGISTNFIKMTGGGWQQYSESCRPKVSVIVPVYNTEPYLRECLDSIKNQTLKEIEIICVDDGSTDNCGKILDEYAANDSRFIVVHQENKGLPMARQAGMDIAKGEYIKHVDSDDYADLRMLEICYNEAKKDDVDILEHNAYWFNTSRQWKQHEVSYQLITEQLFSIFIGYLWKRFYKTDFIKKHNFNFYGVKNMCEDLCFNKICFPEAKKIKTIPDLLYYYRQHPTSICASLKPKNKVQDVLNNIVLVYENWKEKNYFSQEKVRLEFLRGAMKLLWWPKDNEICKMFYDTLNVLIPSFLTDEKLISQLTKHERYKLKRIIESPHNSGKKIKPIRRVSRFRRRVAA